LATLERIIGLFSLKWPNCLERLFLNLNSFHIRLRLLVNNRTDCGFTCKTVQEVYACASTCGDGALASDEQVMIHHFEHNKQIHLPVKAYVRRAPPVRLIDTSQTPGTARGMWDTCVLVQDGARGVRARFHLRGRAPRLQRASYDSGFRVEGFGFRGLGTGI